MGKTALERTKMNNKLSWKNSFVSSLIFLVVLYFESYIFTDYHSIFLRCRKYWQVWVIFIKICFEDYRSVHILPFILKSLKSYFWDFLIFIHNNFSLSVYQNFFKLLQCRHIILISCQLVKHISKLHRGIMNIML